MNRFMQLAAQARQTVPCSEPPAVLTQVQSATPPLLIDVREESEWKLGHAAGAVHLSKGVIERDIEKVAPDPATPLILYCGGGHRSLLAARNLQLMGYSNVISMDGGFALWKKLGFPVE